MKPNIRFLLLHFLALSLLKQAVFSAASCPQGCYCHMDSLIDCTNPTFPMILPPRVIENMSIRGKTLTIPANAFRQPEGNVLKSVSIYPNEISNIKSHAFDNLVLNTLVLYNTRIKHLEGRVFANLTTNSLSIYNSELDTVPAFFLGGLTSASFSLYNNNITTLETNVFKSSNASNKVSLYNNKIDTVQKNAFSGGNLKIDIYMNKIKKFYVQDSMVPRSFYSNKMMCICSLAWMWNEDSAFYNFLASNRCMKTSQYGEIILRVVNQTSLCMSDNSSQTSEWETLTTKTNTEQPTSKETPGTEDTTSFITTKSDPKGASLKHSADLVMIIIESVAVCLFMVF